MDIISFIWPISHCSGQIFGQIFRDFLNFIFHRTYFVINNTVISTLKPYLWKYLPIIFLGKTFWVNSCYLLDSYVFLNLDRDPVPRTEDVCLFAWKRVEHQPFLPLACLPSLFILLECPPPLSISGLDWRGEQMRDPSSPQLSALNIFSEALAVVQSSVSYF